MKKLTAEKCREQFEEWFRLNHDSQLIIKGDGYSNPVNQFMWQAWKASRQALEIALPVLEQPSCCDDIFIVMRNPGKVPQIKRPVGDVVDYVLQLYQHNPDAICDVVTYRFSGGLGQWVQDGREFLAMAGVSLELQEKGDDVWLHWNGEMALPPVAGDVRVEIKRRNGEVTERQAKCFAWRNSPVKSEFDIIAYRVIENDGRKG